MRDEYASRPLEIKIESLILLMLRHNAPNAFYNKSVSVMQQYKEAGIYANDIDPGVMMLNVKKT